MRNFSHRILLVQLGESVPNHPRVSYRCPASRQTLLFPCTFRELTHFVLANDQQQLQKRVVSVNLLFFFHLTVNPNTMI
ncbi:unnamed protein product [Agarophyton chilense]